MRVGAPSSRHQPGATAEMASVSNVTGWPCLAASMTASAGHGRCDKSDEAEEDELASRDLIAVDREDRPCLVDRREELYRVGENDGQAVVKAQLTGLGQPMATRRVSAAKPQPQQRAPRLRPGGGY